MIENTKWEPFIFIFPPFSWQNLKHEGPFAHHIFYLSRWLYSIHPETNAPVIYSNDSSPEASGTLQFDKVCIKVSTLSPQSPWILFFFSYIYIYIHMYLDAISKHILKYNGIFRIQQQRICFFLCVTNIFFSSSVNHRKLRNRDVVSCPWNQVLSAYSALVFILQWPD